MTTEAVGRGVSVNVARGDGVGVTDGVGVRVEVGDAVDVAVAAAPLVGDADAVSVAVGVVQVGVADDVSIEVGVEKSVGVDTGGSVVSVGKGVGVSVAVFVAATTEITVGVGSTARVPSCPPRINIVVAALMISNTAIKDTKTSLRCLSDVEGGLGGLGTSSGSDSGMPAHACPNTRS
jgi:hypothetical protein